MQVWGTLSIMDREVASVKEDGKARDVAKLIELLPNIH